MGPRPSRRGDVKCCMGMPLTICVLQWGHALPGVEIRHRYRGRRLGAHASMGPRPSGRGDGARTSPCRSTSSCFNGATPLRAWRLGACWSHWSTPSTLFNVATPFQAWRLRDWIACDYYISGLQWSHALPDVEISLALAKRRRVQLFNGATPLLAWRRQVLRSVLDNDHR